MSIQPLLNPDSVNDETLNLYCHSITTSTGPQTDTTTLTDHLNAVVYFLNPANGGAVVKTDFKQLTHINDDYVSISGEIEITASGNANGEIDFFLFFNKPAILSDKNIDFRCYINGSSSSNTTSTRDKWLLDRVEFTPNNFTLRFKPSTGDPIGVVPQDIKFHYSFSFKTL